MSLCTLGEGGRSGVRKGKTLSGKLPVRYISGNCYLEGAIIGERGDSQDLDFIQAMLPVHPSGALKHPLARGGRLHQSCPPAKADGLSPAPCLSYTVTVQAKMEPAGPSRDPHSPAAAEAPAHWATWDPHSCAAAEHLVQGSQSRVHGGFKSL